MSDKLQFVVGPGSFDVPLTILIDKLKFVGYLDGDPYNKPRVSKARLNNGSISARICSLA